ncbi:hypothetical protein [Nostoc sp.]|uniref:hypothetical protein n=1 Tax=Nostoc sp. TaxID=1180 RepID=UPI003FA5FDB9
MDRFFELCLNAIALIISHFSKGYKLCHSQLTTASAPDNLAQYAPPYAKMQCCDAVQLDAPVHELPNTQYNHKFEAIAVIKLTFISCSHNYL